MDLGLKKQVAVVTGSGRGIGAETARALAAEGCKVAIWDIDRNLADGVAAEIRDKGGEAIAVYGSVVDSSAVNAAFGTIADTFGAVHILVNNAGFGDDAPLTEMTDEQWHRVIEICLTGPFYCARAAVPYMIKQKYGRIINIASRAHLGIAGKANYCAGKAGVLGLSRSMAAELGVHNITVNTVHPGIVRTERVLAQAMYPELNAQAQQRQLIKREATLSDIVNGILFYASAHSGFVSGDAMFVTGGRLS